MAQTGTLTGRVTNALTGSPVTSVQLTITGTSLAARSDADGRFRVPDVPVTAREVRARGIGYQPMAVPFSLAPNGTTAVAIAMTASTIELDAIVVTGAVGDMRRRAVGHSVGVVEAADVVARSAVSNLTEVLQAKVPGLTVSPTSGTVGTAASYRLRGAGSLGAGNSPTIYVDGVRVSSRTQGNYTVFGQSSTALDAISPADIESIEVIKGPSASTLYGAEAAAGVIQIFTKKGRSGRTEWNTRVETGQSDWDASTRPVNYAVVTAARRDSVSAYPGFQGKALGDLVSFRPMTDGRALRTAGLFKAVLSASGGGDRYTFFVSAGKANEEGVYFNNFSNLTSVRGNVTLVPTNTLTFTTNVALGRSDLRLPLNDNAGPYGLIASSYVAIPGRRYDASGQENYSVITPEAARTYDNRTRADRYTVGASASYAPRSWFRNTLRIGLDANVGQAELYFPPTDVARFVGRVSLGLDNSKGLIAQGRPRTRDATVSYDGTATHQWSSRLVSHSSLGMQYLANTFQRTDAIGVDFGSGALRSVGSAAVRTSSDSLSEQKSIGFYAQQQLSFNDRLFVTLATRMDNNSAFGSSLDRVFYPKASVSYVISDERFFKVPAVSALRLRAAWGQAGNSPGPFDAARSYVSSVVTYSTGSTSALRYASAGNPNLRPERGSEIEIGFESELFGGRAALDASLYDKTTRDALIAVAVPPSTGFLGEQLTNLGEISNAGVEMLLRATPVQRKWLTVEASLSLSTNRNELVSFGYDRGPLLLGSNATGSQRHQEGLPLGGFWAQRPRYNEDGTLLKVDGRPVPDTTTVYVGPSVPAREMAFSSAVVLFGRLRVFGLADYKGGHFQFDVADWRRDQAGVSWETVNPAADPDEVLIRRSSALTSLQIQKADFIKLRDVSVSYDVPSRVMHNVARRASVTLAGHNLVTWSRYRGPDPEVNASGPSRFNRDDFWTVPQTRRYSAAVAVTF
ncbi:MAG TPA: TonB-dependent receptor [Gemmatimonadaceae bacterium]|nr:TonB-dependent receptor [Gemmatimonadaceae bacterium]